MKFIKSELIVHRAARPASHARMSLCGVHTVLLDGESLQAESRAYVGETGVVSLTFRYLCTVRCTILNSDLSTRIKCSQYVYRVGAKGIVGASLIDQRQSLVSVLVVVLYLSSRNGSTRTMVPNCRSTKMTLWAYFLCNRTKTATTRTAQ